MIVNQIVILINMKQFIAIEQLNELSDKAKGKLREWWEPKAGDWFYGTYGDRDVDNEYYDNFSIWILSPYPTDGGFYGASLNEEEDAAPDKNALPLLSIGQMIEFLDTKVKPCYELRKIDLMWLIDITLDKFYQSKDYELCDALWEAIKYILEKEK